MPDERLPYFPIFADDFFGSPRVKLLSGPEQGVYLLLLLFEWTFRGQGLPGDEESLRRALNFTENEWKMAQKVLKTFFSAQNDRFRNHQLETRLMECQERLHKRKDAGRKGAEARWQPHSDRNGKGNADANADANGKTHAIAMASSTPTPTPIPNPIPKNIPKGDTHREQPAAPKSVSDPLRGFFDRWNEEISKALRAPKARSLNLDRRTRIEARLVHHPQLADEILEEARKINEWALERGFITLDWLLRDENLQKFLEGNYREKPKTNLPPGIKFV
jgi:uncharacterized protein YdaU (DUF1376 family)